MFLAAGAAVAATATSSQAADRNCAGTLPSAAPGLPASVVLQTECGAYEVDGNGVVTPAKARRSPWWTPSPFRIGLRRHHVVLIEHGRVQWRSRRVFDVDLSDLGSVAVSGRDLAFSFMDGRLWVSRRDGLEHAVASGEAALQWTRNGDLLTIRRHGGRTELRVRRRDGGRPRLLVRSPLSFAVDEGMRSLLYVTPGRVLVRSDGRVRRKLADLGALGFGRSFELQLLPTDLLAISTSQRTTILRSDGSVFATTRYPAAHGLTYGFPSFAVGPEGVAFAMSLWDSASVHEREEVFLLRAGDTLATPLLSEKTELFGDCGWFVQLEWQQAWLLYTDTLTNVVALDTADGTMIDLTATAQDLPGVIPDPSGNGQTGFEFAVWS